MGSVRTRNRTRSYDLGMVGGGPDQVRKFACPPYRMYSMVIDHWAKVTLKCAVTNDREISYPAGVGVDLPVQIRAGLCTVQLVGPRQNENGKEIRWVRVICNKLNYNDVEGRKYGIEQLTFHMSWIAKVLVALELIDKDKKGKGKRYYITTLDWAKEKTAL